MNIKSWRYLHFIILGLIALAYTAYAVEFIRQSSFLADGVRYFALFDDSMISMTYARNFARGAGMIWNAGGAHVEGFSNPLWVVYMAFFHLFPIPESKMSLMIQVSGLVFLLGSLLFVEKIARRLMPENPVGIYLTVLVAAFYYPFSIWALLGTEVSLLLLIVTASVWQALQVLDTGRFSRGLYVLLGIGTLVRIDMAILFVLIWGWLLVFDAPNRRRHLLWGGGSLLGFLGGQTLLRWLYYGQLLPNTYYLKMTGYPAGLRIQRGFSVLLDFFSGLKFPLYFLPVVLVFFKDRKLTALLLLAFLVQCAYSVYVGGDAWEYRGGSNRFVSLGMPFFFILYITAAAWLLKVLLGGLDWAVGRITRSEKAARVVSVIAQVGAGLTLFFFGAVSLLYFDRLADKGSLRFDLTHPSNRNNPLRYAFLLERPLFTKGSERYVKDALIIRSMTTQDATVALVAAGNLSYFLERTSIDLLGKSDALIASQPVRVSTRPADFLDFRPGHNKWDYGYSLGELKPDVIVELFVYSDPAEADPYLVDYEARTVNGHPMYFLVDSPNIDWGLVQDYPVRP
jgi:arabinofuranosyltransferase